MMDDNQAKIIIDNVSWNIKAGFTNDDAPRVSFPSIIGRSKFKGVMVGID
jgi:actin-related protein